MKTNRKEVGSFDEFVLLYELQEKILDVGIKLMDLVNQKLDIRNDLSLEQSTIYEFNQFYCQSVSTQTLSTLRNGVQSDSIFSMLGLDISCCYVNESFGESQWQRLLFYDLVKKKALSSMSYQKQIACVYRCEEKKRLPLAVDAIAVMCVAFCKQAYLLLRESNNTTDDILKHYIVAIDLLYQMAAVDDIMPDTLNLAIGKFVGYFVEKNPETIRYFDKLTDGQMRKSFGKIVSYDIYEDGQIRTICMNQWDGLFVDMDGQVIDFVLKPRMKSSMFSLAKQHVCLLYNIFSEAISLDGFVELLTSDVFHKARMVYRYMLEDDIGEYIPFQHFKQFSESELLWFIEHGANVLYDPRVCCEKTNVGTSIFERVFHRNPELLTACGQWLHIRLDVNPYYYKSRAHDFMKLKQSTFENDDMVEYYDITISEYFAKYHKLLQIWQLIYVELLTLCLDVIPDYKTLEDVASLQDRLNAFSGAFADYFEMKSWF